MNKDQICGKPTGVVNTPVCWRTESPFTIEMKNGDKTRVETRVENGFATQTLKLYHSNKIKIVSSGETIILKGKDVLKLVDEYGVFWDGKRDEEVSD